MYGFIELQELFYRDGTYLSKPLLCRVSEIVGVEEYDYLGCVEYRTVLLSGRRFYKVKDSYNDIINKIKQASVMEDDCK